ncbi:hypothetical protein F5146DRAFT_1167645 [Armillaria mellea]|nr:hypothetical protein F5146DRAFT_1167645 [Armillaria mellea]
MSSVTRTASSNHARPKAPIDVLPDEMLLEIFTFGAHTSENTSFPFLASIICKSWRSLAIGEPRLWTNLSLTLTSAVEPPPVPADSPSLLSMVFPREALILKRSANRDTDVDIEYEDAEDGEPRYQLTEDHLLIFSQLLADHAHRIRSLRIETLDWPEIHLLCIELHGIPMPRLQSCSLTALCSEIRVGMDVYEEETEPVTLLDYPRDDDALPPTCQDLQSYNSALYLALKDVCLSGVPTHWAGFCASNLRELYLENQPLEERPSMEILRGILFNSQNTLEYLELTYVIGLDEELGNPPSSGSRLTLPHVKKLKLVYIDPREAQQIFRAFDFPALRMLTINSHNENENSSVVLADVLKYVRIEELLDLRLIGIALPPEDFSEQELNQAKEESLPLVLAFLRRLTRGNLFKLVLHCCCNDFLKFMNYREGKSGGGKVNLFGLKDLVVKAGTEDASVGAMTFIRDRLALGTVNGVYIGPVMDHMLLILKPNVEEEAHSFGGGELAKDRRFMFRNIMLM